MRSGERLPGGFVIRLRMAKSGMFCLARFIRRFWRAFYLKIIGRETRREIDLVRKIRNVAAHDMNPISFDESPEIANRCRELRLAMEQTDDDPTKRSLRERFLHTLRLYIIGLTLRASKTSKLDATYLDR
jgi:hypothetical protein